MNITSYKWWWTRFIGRPWTFFMRDVWHKYEIIPIVIISTVAGVVTTTWGIKQLFASLLVLSVGYLLGHLFWGKKYIENQQG